LRSDGPRSQRPVELSTRLCAALDRLTAGPLCSIRIGPGTRANTTVSVTATTLQCHAVGQRRVRYRHLNLPPPYYTNDDVVCAWCSGLIPTSAGHLCKPTVMGPRDAMVLPAKQLSPHINPVPVILRSNAEDSLYTNHTCMWH
jgi:hypothetical protein